MSAWRYLLDTNIVSELIRRPHGTVAQRVATVGIETVCTSVIVACEIQYGAVKKRSARIEQRLLELLEEVPALPFDLQAYSHYGRIRAELEACGRPIGANDLFIAAHSLSLDLTLVTHNVKEFSRVHGLAVEDWLAG